MKNLHLKRILSMMFALLLVVGALPTTLLAAADSGVNSIYTALGDFDEFSSKISKLLSETMEDDYISAITLEVGSGEMVVDGETQPLGTEQHKAPVLDDGLSYFTHINGKGIDKAEIHTKEFWEAVGFTFGDGAWTWNEGKMPGLAIGPPFDWPEWLRIDEYHISYENGNVTAEVAETGTYTIILAAYKEETLISVEIAEEVFENPGKKVIVPVKLQTDGADTVKAMLWDSADSMSPLCASNECSSL